MTNDSCGPRILFFLGIEENVDTQNLEENLAVVQIGQSRAQVRQHLTNDYNRIRDAIGEQNFTLQRH